MPWMSPVAGAYPSGPVSLVRLSSRPAYLSGRGLDVFGVSFLAHSAPRTRGLGGKKSLVILSFLARDMEVDAVAAFLARVGVKRIGEHNLPDLVNEIRIAVATTLKDAITGGVPNGFNDGTGGAAFTGADSGKTSSPGWNAKFYNATTVAFFQESNAPVSGRLGFRHNHSEVRVPEVRRPEGRALEFAPRGPARRSAPWRSAPRSSRPEVRAPRSASRRFAPWRSRPEVAPRSSRPEYAPQRFASWRSASRRSAPGGSRPGGPVRRSAPWRFAPQRSAPGVRVPEVRAPEVRAPEVRAWRSAPGGSRPEVRALAHLGLATIRVALRIGFRLLSMAAFSLPWLFSPRPARGAGLGWRAWGEDTKIFVSRQRVKRIFSYKNPKKAPKGLGWGNIVLGMR